MIQWVMSSISLLDFCCLSIAKEEAQSFFQTGGLCMEQGNRYVIPKATITTMSRHVLSELLNILFDHLYSYESVKKIKKNDE